MRLGSLNALYKFPIIFIIIIIIIIMRRPVSICREGQAKHNGQLPRGSVNKALTCQESLNEVWPAIARHV